MTKGEEMFCSNCGAKIDQNSNFCKYCGHRVKDVEIFIEERPTNNKYEEIPSQLNIDDIKNIKKKNLKDKNKKTENKESKFPKFIEEKLGKDSVEKKNSTKLKSKDEIKTKDESFNSELSIKFDGDKEESDFSYMPYVDIDLDRQEDFDSEGLDKNESFEVKEESESKSKNIFKRFFDFMKEDEDYLQLDLTSQEQEIENTDYSGGMEDLKEELEENLTLAIEELEPVEIEKTEPKKGILVKLKEFLNQEDEDNLLELDKDEFEAVISGEEYPLESNIEELNSDYQTSINENEIKKVSFKDKILGVFKKDELDGEAYEEDLAENKSIDYKDATIVYSKKVIESSLNEEVKKDGDQKELRPEEKETFEIKSTKNEKHDEIIEVKPVEEIVDKTSLIEEIIDPEEIDTPSKDHYVDNPVDLSKWNRLDYEEEDKKKNNFILEFIISIKEFFLPKTKDKALEEDYDETKEDLDIVVSDSRTNMADTMPLELSDEEILVLENALNEKYKVSKYELFFRKMHKKMAPVIRDLIKLGAKVRIPLFLIIWALASLTISFVTNNSMFILVMGLVKFFASYIIISVPTKSALNSVGVRLKSSVVSLFVMIQMLIFHIIDTIYVRLTLVEGASIEALLHVLSPSVLSIIVLVFLAVLLMTMNYRRIMESHGSLIFLGWYIVVSTILLLMTVLFELLIVTIMSTLFLEILI